MANLRGSLEQALGSAYAFERELGGGGMSRVFVARDTTLDRLIVVKVLPQEAAASVSAERFKREIALAAKLQHPHIVPLLAAGEVNGLPFFTMPFVEGQSLRERLTREGELAIDEVVEILKEVGRALAYAHEHGIVHRDIKPENIMLSGGSAMVTDFGVAKALSASTAHERAGTLTELGVALGTPAYMAPEQAAGAAVIDHRADLYAFGCTAYELLCGHPPFTGRPPQALLGAHVSETPEHIQKRRATVPAPLAGLVMQCLEKHPADRPKSAADVVRTLEGIVLTPRGTGTWTGARTTEGAPRAAARWLTDSRTLVAVAVVVIMAAAQLLSWTRARDERSRVVVSSLVPEGDHRILTSGGVAVSPDGSRMAYVGIGADNTVSLWIREFGGLAATRLDGTDRAWLPFWSPDGKRLAYFAGGQLRVRTISGGQDVALCSTPYPEGGAWGSRDIIVYAPKLRGALYAVPASGGKCEQVTTLAAGVLDHRRPSFLPDGRHFVFGSGSAGAVYMGDLETKQHRVLRTDIPYAAFAPPGYLLFIKDGTLYAQRLSGRTARLGSEARPILQRATVDEGNRPVFSEGNGMLVSGVTTTERVELVRVRRGSSEIDRVPLPSALVSPRGIRLSRDGRQVTIGSTTGLWVHDLERMTTTGVALGSDIVDMAVWSPGDSLFAYVKSVGNDMGVRIFDRRTNRAWSLVPSDTVVLRPMDWSPDGRTIVYWVPTGFQVRVFQLDVATKTSRELVMPAGVGTPIRFSPDNQWLAFHARETGRFEVYVQRVRGGGAPIRVTRNGGVLPQWIGRELVYRALDSSVAAVTVSLGPTPRFGEPRTLTRTAPPGDMLVTPDGQEFIGISAPLTVTLTLVQNWTALLRR